MGRVRVEKSESKLEKVREAEWEYIETQPNLFERYVKSWPDKSIFWASMQIVMVVGSDPTWVNFLYQLLNAFTQFWIPQVSLTGRLTDSGRVRKRMRTWVKER